MSKKLLLLLLLPLLASTAHAQEVWTLQRCIEYAQQHNLQVQLAQLNVQQAEENLRQSKEARMPNANFQAAQQFSWGRSLDFFTNTYTNSQVTSNTFGFSSSVDLFGGFRLTRTIEQRGVNIQVSQQDVLKARNDLGLNLAGGYLQILLAKENVSAAQGRLAGVREQLARTQKLVDAGSLPMTNLLDLKAQLANNELQLVQAQNTEAIALLRLKQFLQVPASTQIDIFVPELPDPEAGATALPMPGEVYDQAEEQMPEVKSALLSMKAAVLSEQIAKSAYYPTLTLSGGVFTNYSSVQKKQVQDGVRLDDNGNPILIGGQPIPVYKQVNYPFWEQLGDARREQVSLTLTVPIYNRRQSRSQLQSARIGMERARLNAEVTKNQLRQQIEQAYTDALAAEKTYQASRSQVQALGEQLRAIETRFNSGAANVTEYNVAQNNLAVAQNDRNRAKYEYIFRLKVLDFYMGRGINL